MKIAYYPGCSAKGSSLDYELSTQAVLKALGIKTVEIADWNCCGSTPAHAVATDLSTALCTRNLALAAKQGADLIATSCPSCLSNHKHAYVRMQDPDFRTRVNELLDEPAPEELPEMTSVMQLIAQQCDSDQIKSRICRLNMPLSELEVAAANRALNSFFTNIPIKEMNEQRISQAEFATGAEISEILVAAIDFAADVLNRILNRDMYLAGAIVMVQAFLVEVGILLADIGLAFLDPRIRFSGGSR